MSLEKELRELRIEHDELLASTLTMTNALKVNQELSLEITKVLKAVGTKLNLLELRVNRKHTISLN